MDSVKIAAAQKEAAGLAYHFAARVTHLRAAIGAIAGKVGLGGGLCLNLPGRLRVWLLLLAHHPAV